MIRCQFSVLVTEEVNFKPMIWRRLRGEAVFINSESFTRQDYRLISVCSSPNCTGMFFFFPQCHEKTSGFSSRVKPFAQQKWFLVASKTKCSKHSRKHINGLVPFLGLWSLIFLFFLSFFFFPFMISSSMQSLSRVQCLKILTIVFHFSWVFLSYIFWKEVVSVNAT